MDNRATVTIRLNREKAIEAALEAAAAAARVLLDRSEPHERAALKQWMKSPGALVTEADIESDRVISETLKRAGVPGRILSEESRSGRASDELTWLIDPLCGTVPYSTGMQHWGLNIALRRGGTLELAVLALPTLGETLSAVIGKGVKMNGRRWSPRAPGTRLSDVAVGLEVDGGEMWKKLLKRGLGWVPECGQVNTFASAAYPLGLVCLGRLSAFVIYGGEPVHIAAGAAIALELGLEVTDGKGGPVDWSGDGELPCMVVGWPEVHAQLMEAMRRARS